MSLLRLLALFLAICQPMAGLAADEGMVWKLVASDRERAVLMEMGSDGQRAVVVGDKGAIFIDGEDGRFGLVESGVTSKLRAVTFSNGVWVACGDNGAITRSLDGRAWASQASGTVNDLYDVHAADGLFVAVGEAATVLTSPDGITWTPRGSGGSGGWFTGVTRGNGLWLAVGWGAPVAISSDGIHWTRPVTGLTDNLDSVTHDGTKFLATTTSSTGKVIASTDGTTWQSLAVGIWLYDIHAEGSLFVAGSYGGRIAVSNDGIAWTHRQTGLPGTVYAVYRHAGQWWAVGDGGGIARSDDAMNWSVRAGGPSSLFNDAIWTGENWLAVGIQISRSTDGVTWQSSWNPTSRILNGVALAGGRYVAVGEYGQITWSDDGLVWTAASSGTSTHWIGVVWHQGKWLAIAANGTLCTSTNGMDWSLASMAVTGSLTAITGNGSLLVAANYDGSVWISTDGIAWQKRSTGSTAQWRDITCMDGRFVLVGGGEEVCYSDDGLNWTTASVGVRNLTRVASWPGRGLVATDGVSTIHSTDGITWGARTIVQGNNWTTTAGSPGGFLLAGGTAYTPAGVGLSANGTDWEIPWPSTTGSFSQLAASGTNMIGIDQDTSSASNLWVADTPARWTNFSDLGGFAGYSNSCQWTGSGYVVADEDGRVNWSADGMVWTHSVIEPGVNLNDATARGQATVAVGNGGSIWFSPDRENWTLMTSPFSWQSMRSVAAGPAGWLAGGDSGALAHSVDGQTWTNVSIPSFSANIIQIRWLNGQFFVLGGGSNIWTSPDGLTWTSRFAGHGFHKAITWSGRRYVVVGLGGRIFTSTDAMNWETASSPSGLDLDCVVWTGTSFFACGRNGAVVSEPDHAGWASTMGLPIAQQSWQADVGGIPGGIARVLGGDPAAAQSRLPRMDTSVSPPALQWTRDFDMPDNSRVTIESSADLQNWSQVAWKNGDLPWRGTNGISETNRGDGSIHVRYQPASPATARKWYRIHVLQVAE